VSKVHTIGLTYTKGKCIKEIRLSGIHGIHDVSIPGGHAPPERRRMRDQSKAGIVEQVPDGGFADELEQLRDWGMIP